MASTFRYLFGSSRETRPAQPRFEQKLDVMASWQAGWSFGAGLPISDQSRAAARDYAHLGLGFGYRVDVFPDLDGGCSVALYEGDVKFELSFNENGTLGRFSAEQGIGFDYEDVFEPMLAPSTAQVEAVLAKYANDECGSSEFLTFASTTPLSSVSETAFYEILRRSPAAILLTTEVGYQSSKETAPAPTTDQTAFVYTAGSTTGMLPLSP